MALLKIVSYPDPVLATFGDPVTRFDDELQRLTANMFETMYEAKGVGLAAQQIGLALQLFVMDCEDTRIVAANPQIILQEGEQKGDEACLSLGSIGAPLIRGNHVRLRAQDVKGEWYEVEGTGLTARCLQHETDHCRGLLFMDHLSPLNRDILKRKFRKATRRD
jgi:peptide deformylase